MRMAGIWPAALVGMNGLAVCMALYFLKAHALQGEGRQTGEGRDRLTGFLYWSGFEKTVRRILNAGPDLHWIILCIKICDFEVIGEIIGTEAAEKFLRKTAGEIRSLFPESIAGRIDRACFAVCVEKKDFDRKRYDAAMRNAERAEEAENCEISIRTGIYEVEDTALSVVAMCGCAYLAAVRSAESIRMEAADFDSRILAATLKNKRMENDFRAGLLAGQFRLYLQPQAAASGQLLGEEALVRWLHPERGLSFPDEFIPVLERYGLMHLLDRHIWEQAVRQLKAWEGTPAAGLYISINISRYDLQNMDVYEELTGLTERYGIDRRLLHLEITETFTMDEIVRQIELVSRLREYGFQVWIDDFGSGYSSLSELKRLRVDGLKLDLRFLRLEKEDDSYGRIILEAVIAMAGKLGLEIVAEGVETEEQAAFLQAAGCAVFQGYLFGKPMEVSDFRKRFLFDRLPVQ
jgi:EAL domain-containing protein (putative c-di-GMP-specific phosphodiesterase class I)/GGDEF domain-containing protein